MGKKLLHARNNFGFFKSERGFNMFSAIVAVILLMTSVVLTNTLVTTEEKTSRQVYNMLSNYQLADAANIARADALQTFNYNFRERMESYLTASNTEALSGQKSFALFTFRKDSTGSVIPPGFTINDLRKNFQENILLTKGSTNQFQAVLEYVSENTISQFKGDTYGRYSVQLDVKPSEIPSAKVAMANAMQSVLVNTDFLEVVGCEESSCPLGTFYFNIPLNNLSDAAYEQLPRIVVRDIVTGEEIKMAILPKTNIKVYIPLRYFKVLKEASDAAKVIQGSHGTIAGYRLGFCSNSCDPNNDPTNVNSIVNRGSAKSCPTVQIDSEVNLAANVVGQTTYKSAPASTAGREGLWAYTVNQLCEAGAGANVFSIEDIPTTAPSALFPTGTSSSSATPTAASMGLGGLSAYFEPGAGDKRGASGGAYMDYFSQAGSAPGTTSTCGFYSLDIRIGAERTARIQGYGTTGDAYLGCGQVEFISAEMAFKEINPAYIVRGTFDDASTTPTDVFIIRIEDRSFNEAQKNTTPTKICNSTPSTCG